MNSIQGVLTLPGVDGWVSMRARFQKLPLPVLLSRSVGWKPHPAFIDQRLGKVIGREDVCFKCADKGGVIQADFQDRYLLWL